MTRESLQGICIVVGTVAVLGSLAWMFGFPAGILAGGVLALSWGWWG